MPGSKRAATVHKCKIEVVDFVLYLLAGGYFVGDRHDEDCTVEKRGTKGKTQPIVLKGWKDIAQFLGQPSSTAQRWAKEGMPVERTGRRVEAQPDKLNQWLGRVSHEPVQIATEASDLSSELRRGLAYVRGPRSRSQRK